MNTWKWRTALNNRELLNAMHTSIYWFHSSHNSFNSFIHSFNRSFVRFTQKRPKSAEEYRLISRYTTRIERLHFVWFDMMMTGSFFLSRRNYLSNCRYAQKRATRQRIDFLFLSSCPTTRGLHILSIDSLHSCIHSMSKSVQHIFEWFAKFTSNNFPRHPFDFLFGSIFFGWCKRGEGKQTYSLEFIYLCNICCLYCTDSATAAFSFFTLQFKKVH